MWSRPFVIQTEKHGEVAVLLMDTQGIMERGADITESTGVMGLSAMFASVQVPKGTCKL